MERRTFMSLLGGVIGVSSIKAIAAPDKQMLFVLHLEDELTSPAALANYEARWNEIFEGNPPGKLVVIQPGAKLSVIGDDPIRWHEKYEEREVELVAPDKETFKELWRFLFGEDR